LEVWRSTSGESGPYEELTAASYSFPRIPADAEDAPVVPVVGPSAILDTLELELEVEGSSQSVLFAGVDPITYGDAATQSSAQLAGAAAYVAPDGRFVLEGASGGQLASLEVTGGDAAPNLGLVVGTKVYGKDPRVHLYPEQVAYTYTDLLGSRAYFYKTRLRNASTGVTGEYSRAFSVASVQVVEPSSVIVGQVDLVQLDGKPLVNREVRLHTAFNGTTVDGKTLAGGDVVKATDARGHVEFRLLRGQQLTVAVPGTSLYRLITVPSDPLIQTFNLLDPSIGGDDIFKVVVPDIIVAERRSL
jgi:hypothetical protein